VSKFLNHLQERVLFDPSELERDGSAWIDEENEVVTFPLWNLSGQLIGYQKYRWGKPKGKPKHGSNNPLEQRYFTRLARGVIGVYGLQNLPVGYLGPIYIVEGVWEAVVGNSYGITCVAILGVNKAGVSKSVLGWINSLPNDIIPLCQADEAGQFLSKINPNRAIYLEKDLDDLIIEASKRYYTTIKGTITI
jgi:hypothetical protein